MSASGNGDVERLQQEVHFLRQRLANAESLLQSTERMRSFSGTPLLHGAASVTMKAPCMQCAPPVVGYAVVPGVPAASIAGVQLSTQGVMPMGTVASSTPIGGAQSPVMSYPSYKVQRFVTSPPVEFNSPMEATGNSYSLSEVQAIECRGENMQPCQIGGPQRLSKVPSTAGFGLGSPRALVRVGSPRIVTSPPQLPGSPRGSPQIPSSPRATVGIPGLPNMTTPAMGSPRVHRNKSFSALAVPTGGLKDDQSFSMHRARSGVFVGTPAVPINLGTPSVPGTLQGYSVSTPSFQNVPSMLLRETVRYDNKEDCGSSSVAKSIKSPAKDHNGMLRGRSGPAKLPPSTRGDMRRMKSNTRTPETELLKSAAAKLQMFQDEGRRFEPAPDDRESSPGSTSRRLIPEFIDSPISLKKREASQKRRSIR